MLTVQGGPVETKVGTGRTVSELSQIGCRHTPASEFPIEHQQSRGGGRLADAQILVHKISMHECPRHKITDSFDFFPQRLDRKSTRLNSSHGYISYAVFCLKKKKQ